MLQRRRRDGPTACQTCATVLLASGAVAQVRLAKPMPVSPRLICPRRVRKALRTPSRASAISAVDLCDTPRRIGKLPPTAALRRHAGGATGSWWGDWRLAKSDVRALVDGPVSYTA